MTEPVRFCGVAVLDDREYPCILEPGHDGFCDFGPEYAKDYDWHGDPPRVGR
jgi:hypothetical protein